MIIKVPYWITKIQDEEVALFSWFCDRTCRLHGYDTYYSIHVDDVVRILNKRNNGLLDWWNSLPHVTDWITMGSMYDEVFVFHMKAKSVSEREPHRQAEHKWALRSEQMYDYCLTRERSKLVFMYLLGCLNSNMIEEDTYSIKQFNQNAFGIKEFKLDRIAKGYIKKKDRPCGDEE